MEIYNRFFLSYALLELNVQICEQAKKKHDLHLYSELK